MSYESVVLADHPSFLWLLNENSGSTAADATGNGNTGAYSGTGYSPTSAVVPLFQSVAADCTSGGSVTGNTTLSASQTVSAECWFNTSSALGGCIVQYGSTNFVVWMHNNGTLSFGLWDGSAAHVAGQTSLAYNDSKWHYVAATFNGTSTNMFLYADGAQVASATAPSYVAGNSKWFAAGGAVSWATYPGSRGGPVSVITTASSAATIGWVISSDG